MYTRFLTSSIYGLSGEETWVEVDCDKGLPGISIVGLANQSIKEAKDRIHSAIVNCGFRFPQRKITVNLTPANKQKTGSHYDLPIALGVLNSSGLIHIKNPEINADLCTAFLGELTLDGRVNQIDGALPMIIGLQKKGVKEVFLPEANIREAVLIKNMTIYPITTLLEVVNHLVGTELIEPLNPENTKIGDLVSHKLDFCNIKGQEIVKRAAQVSAAGRHGLLMIGPPGVGKSMIGKCIPSIMPPLSYEEQLEVTQIYSVAGELSATSPLIKERPFRAPHHSISATALIGGGVIPKPGEISLAHKGVLFLDELPEFSVHALDMLRQPLEDGYVSITRVNGNVVFPSSFMLVAAMNPCKCGYYGDPIKPCKCTESERKRYLGRVSGPLLDRIDIHVSLQRPIYDDISSPARTGKSTADLKHGVETAVEMQKHRFKLEFGTDNKSDNNILWNSSMDSSMINKYCSLNNECNKVMEDVFRKWALSARSFHKILRVARTIADMNESGDIEVNHLLEALSYRMPDQFTS